MSDTVAILRVMSTSKSTSSPSSISASCDLGVDTNATGRRDDTRQFPGSDGASRIAASAELTAPSRPRFARLRRIFFKK